MPFISADRDQTRLFPQSLGELVEPDAKCRFVLSLIEQLDLSALYGRYSARGAEAYDPAMMLACWFYAYSEGISSTRKLEACCRRDVHFIYLSANLRPDHTSFSRFRKSHLDLMGGYFVELVQLAVRSGVSDFGLLAVDGTRIQASASPNQCRDENGLERSLERVRSEIDAYMRECDRVEASEAEKEAAREAIEHKRKEEARIIERGEQLAERKAVLKAEHRRRHKINLVEPEAFTLDKVNGPVRLPAYNAQFVVDTTTHLITACDAVQDRNDQRQFARMHRQAETTLADDSPHAFVGDAGYHSLDQLAYIDAEEVNAVIADPTPGHRSRRAGEPPLDTEPQESKDGLFKRSDFTYDPIRDCYTCPAGERLDYERLHRLKGRRKHVYAATACPDCARKDECLPTGRLVRRIHRDEEEHLAEAMYSRLQSEEATSRLKARRESVEPVIGNVKANLGFRRFSLRGLEQVKGELFLMAIAHNLNKLSSMALQGAFLDGWIRPLISSAKRLLHTLCAVLSMIIRPRLALTAD